MIKVEEKTSSITGLQTCLRVSYLIVLAVEAAASHLSFFSPTGAE